MTSFMEREPTIVIRPFETVSDVPRLARLLQAVEAVDRDGEDVSEDTLREQLALPGHDPTRDRWVAAELANPATLLGWGFAWRVADEPLATLAGAVLPAWRERGIGSALLERALARAGELGAKVAGVYANAHNAAATRFVLAHGFRPVASNTLLRVGGDVCLAEPAIPDNYTVRPYSEDITSTSLAQALSRSYAGLWGHHRVSESFVTHLLARRRPEDILLLLAPGGDIVGVCRVERFGEAIPYIDAPGVVREQRSAELYVALLLAACAHLRSTHPAAIEMESWGDADETLAAYQALGFAVVRQTTAYECPILKQ
ncbi:MAG TPA: GNAT family N-acetyltransferase [Ktedonobacterales bacterium]|nr:GNAT family N-acetyltransferase [Ktedonobacterales bacterium]